MNRFVPENNPQAHLHDVRFVFVYMCVSECIECVYVIVCFIIRACN